MPRIVLALLAASSVLLAATAARGATRPRYGGTLHANVRGAPMSLDPADQIDFEQRNVTSLIFDTLITLDDRGKLQASVATAWRNEAGRLQITLRHGVRFQDGSQLTSDAVASSLAAANPKWNITPTTDGVTIETDDPEILPELALPRNAILKRGPQLIGTGPFAIATWQPGKHVTLAAFEDCWRGRPFVDSVELDLGKAFRDQMLALDARRAEVIEVRPEQARHAVAQGRRIENSTPIELVALVFTRDARNEDDSALRDALRYAIDRTSINTVLLQNAGEPSAALLPQWMSGYAFLFPAAADLGRARQLRALLPAPTWTLSYDSTDPLARLVAERVLLNGQDIGLRLQLTTNSAADIRIIRLPLRSLDPQLALELLASDSGLPRPAIPSDSPDALYQAETAMLQSRRIVPLVYLPVSYAISSAVRNWSATRDGTWRLDDVWF